MAAYFSTSLFSFLGELEANNRREWFEANRERYLADVQEPMLRFITDLGPHLRSISPAVTADARRMGGSMYRIHRDTRFSPDKSPYKTHVAARFMHRQRKQAPSAPGFYLHLEPGDCMGGGGIYHPDPATLTRIRLAIVENGSGWDAVTRTGPEIQGDRLARAPAGFDRSHPSIEHLRLKDFYALIPLSQKEVCASDFLERYLECCRRVAPLVAFITRSMGWRW